MVHKTLAILFLLLIIQCDAITQQRQQRMQRGTDRLEMLRQVRMIEALDLDKESAARLSVLFAGHQEKVREIQRQIENLIDDLETAIEGDEPDDTLLGIQSQIEEQRTLLHSNRIEFYRDVGSLISTRQVAMLIVFERNFQRDMREIMQDVQQRRRRPR
jgi:Skp family chaperone for outer membrane proteins